VLDILPVRSETFQLKTCCTMRKSESCAICGGNKKLRIMQIDFMSLYLHFILLVKFFLLILKTFNMDLAYLNFLNYANEKIQRARILILQSDDLNFLEMYKEQLELLISILNQLLLNISEVSESYQIILTYLRETQNLLNQYIIKISQLGDDEFLDVGLFISKEISTTGKL